MAFLNVAKCIPNKILEYLEKDDIINISRLCKKNAPVCFSKDTSVV